MRSGRSRFPVRGSQFGGSAGGVLDRLGLALLPIVVAVLTLGFAREPEPGSPVHVQRYSMGTMFDIVVYHESRSDAGRAVADAMAEVSRLDSVLSHYQADSELSKLARQPRDVFVAVEPSLFEVLEQSIAMSRISGGRFDITVGPLVKLWKQVDADGRTPSDAQISAARQCVGFDKIEIRAPSHVRLRSDCLQLDLGGIGKGYAVDRAMRVLTAAGIRHAMINAGGSSIAAIGSPPGSSGWPVSIPSGHSDRTLLLRDTSISTSQQNPTTSSIRTGQAGEIVDPSTGVPIASPISVRVIAPSATTSDGLSTTLLLLSREEGSKLLGQFPGVSALWLSETGELQGTYGEAHLRFVDSR